MPIVYGNVETLNIKTLTIEVSDPYTVTLPTKTEGYTIVVQDGSSSPVEDGGSYSFKVDFLKNYTEGVNFTVKANGTTLTPVGDVYTISDIQESQTITVEGVVLKDADYSDVDAALGEIPADLNIYTEASVQALNNAKEAVVRGKKITEQKMVDDYAAAIKAAIIALELKPVTPSPAKPDTNNPQTGDHFHMGFWIALSVISFGGISALFLNRKRLEK